MKRKALLLAVLGCALLWTISAAAAPGQKDHTMKAGKKGEITLTQPTKNDEVVVRIPKRSIERAENRAQGERQVVKFMPLGVRKRRIVPLGNDPGLKGHL